MGVGGKQVDMTGLELYIHSAWHWRSYINGDRAKQSIFYMRKFCYDNSLLNSMLKPASSKSLLE